MTVTNLFEVLDFGTMARHNWEWAKIHFPDNEPWQPILGMMEEAGELSHSLLKMTQGIRGSKEQHLAAVRGAVADVVIYLADFLNREYGPAVTHAGLIQHEPLEWCYDPSIPVLDVMLNVSSAIHSIGVTRKGSPMRPRGIDDLEALEFHIHAGHSLLTWLQHICFQYHFSFRITLWETWFVVKQRDWKGRPDDAHEADQRNRAQLLAQAENDAGDVDELPPTRTCPTCRSTVAMGRKCLVCEVMACGS